MPELLLPSRELWTPMSARALKVPAPGNSSRFRAARFTSSSGRPRAATTECEVCCGGEPPPTGACCRANGECLITEEGACLSLPGTWLGPNTTCAGNPCGPPPPSCCTSTRCWNQCAAAGPVVLSLIATASCTLQRCCPGDVVVSGQFTQVLTRSQNFSASCAQGATGNCTLAPSITHSGNFPVPGSIAPCDGPGVVSFSAGASAASGPGGVPGWNLTAGLSNCGFGNTIFVPGCTGASGSIGPIQSQLANCGPTPNYRLCNCTFEVTVSASGRYACPGASASLRGVSPGDIDAARAAISGLAGGAPAAGGSGCSGCGSTGAGGALI